MKKTTKANKLLLSVTKIRDLDDSALRSAYGGGAPSDPTCDNTKCFNNTNACNGTRLATGSANGGGGGINQD